MIVDLVITLLEGIFRLRSTFRRVDPYSERSPVHDLGLGSSTALSGDLIFASHIATAIEKERPTSRGGRLDE